MLNNRFDEVFEKKPIIGMIHLGGLSPVKSAMEELEIFLEEGVDGAIIENYHGRLKDVLETLAIIKTLKERDECPLVIGVNILPNEYNMSLRLAHEHHADFVQLDYVAGKYMNGAELNVEEYAKFKKQFPEINVMGGVWPKYYNPIEGSDLEKDLQDGMERAEAIVVTGAGTGKETPTEKIKKFREIIGYHKLIVGAGSNPKNVYEQLSIADGVIIGSYFKPDENTNEKSDSMLIRDYMAAANEARN